MTGEHWTRIETAFAEAVELPQAEREAFVAASCADDVTLRDEVLRLLACDSGDRLHEVVGAAARDLVREAAVARIGERIGPYRVVALIGRGGMGCVYRAERDDGAFRRTVAIKVLETGTGTHALARFRDERQILARLAHPNIVRLVDGGTTDDGVPYLVMDLVAGIPVTAFANELPVAACIELVIAMCDALEYAHGLGVIHRDIKPSNILVGDAGPQLVDFGIAKLAGPTVEREASTRTGAALLTPEYASPEQARGEPVSAATDLYSLGAVLYELLAHRRPLPLEGNMLEVLREISELEPPRPSAVAPPGRQISRDLDRIVLCTLRKDPRERYASAAALATDLRAYLAGQDVSPPAPRPRRARWALAAAGAIVIAAGAAWVVTAQRPRPWLPGGDHALAVRVTGDDQLAPAATRMAAKALRTRERRFVTVDDARAADVTAELTIRRDGDGIAISGALVAAGRLPLREVRAASVETALATLVPAIGDAVGGERAPRDADASERAAMERIGAASLDEYRAYTAVADAQLGTIKSDSDAIRRDLETLVARDPGWAHPWALLVLANGFTTNEPTDLPTLARAKAAMGSGARDPSGRAVLESIERIEHDDTAGAAQRLEPVAAEDPADMLVALQLHNAYSYGGRPDESIALLRRVHELRPDLAWGADLAGELRTIGRGVDVEPLVHAWIERAPDSEQAQVSLIALELAAHRTDAALQHARDLLVLHDEAPHRLLLLCDVLITAGREQEAARVAEKLLHGSMAVRAWGLQRMGTIEILEGRFAVAMQTLLPTGPDATALARAAPVLEIGLDVALALGRDEVVASYDDALASRHRGWDDILGSRQHPFERALARGQCPSIDATLDGMTWPTAGLRREDARRWLLRASAERGCVACKEVLRAGRISLENDDRSAFRFATCAETEGELALAADMLARLREPRLGSLEHTYGTHPFVWIMARYHNARVLERLGRPDEARREYDDFLAHWGHADTALPEIDSARAALARLPK
jgi:tetratricopeptide (TPR) repeat protein